MNQPAATYQLYPIGTIHQSEAGFCLEIKAEYRDGILALYLPRSERDKPRTIKIG